MSFDEIWRYTPDWSEPVTETLTYSTDIRPVQSGTEYRARKREHPRRRLEWSMLEADDQLRKIDALLVGTSIDRWLVPLWWDVGIADYSFEGSIHHYESSGLDKWRDWQAGEYIVARSPDGTVWDGMEISTVGDDYVAMVGEPDAALQADNVRVYPAFVAALQSEQPRDALAPHIGDGRVVFELVDYEAPAGSGLSTTYDSHDLWLDRPDRSEVIESRYLRQIDSVDFGVGPIARYDDASNPLIDSSASDIYGDRERLWELREWWQSVGGAYGEWYAPTHQSDLDVVSASSLDIGVRPVVDWSTRYTDHASRTHLHFQLKDGTTLQREITGSSISGDTETLTLGSAISFDADDVQKCSWLELARFAGDEQQIEWLTPGVARISYSKRALRTESTL